MNHPPSRLERAGARLRPAALLAFMVLVFTAVSGDRAPVDPVPLSAEDEQRVPHAAASTRSSRCPDARRQSRDRFPRVMIGS